jgi:hypothetical protein
MKGGGSSIEGRYCTVPNLGKILAICSYDRHYQLVFLIIDSYQVQNILFRNSS